VDRGHGRGPPGLVVTGRRGVNETAGFLRLNGGALELATFDAIRREEDTAGTSLSNRRRYGICQRVGGHRLSRNARARGTMYLMTEQ